MTLSERQEKMLDFIEAFIDENGYPPTIREIGQAVGITSTSVVNYNLNKLQTANRLDRDRQKSRGLKLPSTTLHVPLLGKIAAGRPIPVPEPIPAHEAEDTIELTRDLVGNREDVFALHVKGNSMIDALINDGDVVVLQATETATNGEMVAVWLEDEGETTLKRFYLEDGRVRLQPANPLIEPIFAHPGNVRVQGRVIAVIRSLN